MRHETTVGDPFAVLKPVLLAIPAELRDEFSAPAEACSADWEILALILLERLHEVEDSWPADGRATEEEEGSKDAQRIEDMWNLGERPAWFLDRRHRAQKFERKDVAY